MEQEEKNPWPGFVPGRTREAALDDEAEADKKDASEELDPEQILPSIY